MTSKLIYPAHIVKFCIRLSAAVVKADYNGQADYSEMGYDIALFLRENMAEYNKFKAYLKSSQVSMYGSAVKGVSDGD